MTLVEATVIDSPSSTALVRPVASVNDLVETQRAYQDVCIKLLDSNDLQVIGKKTFKKRSAWNKLAVAFGVSTTEVRTTHERDERGRIIRTECVVRAEAPNGRKSDGIGACDLYERCCDPETCSKLEVWEDSGKPTGHKHCQSPCKQAHFSNPQHDIPATAFTRASNRAKADLFGSGEVSAEEVTGDNSAYQHDEQPTVTRTYPSDPEGAAYVSNTPAAKKNTENMLKRIFAVSKKLGWEVPAVVLAALGEDIPEADLTFAQCRKINDYLSEQLEAATA